MTSDPANLEARVCAVCGFVLERIHDRASNHTYFYQHSLQDPDDHPPVPVRYGEAGRQARLRCDFCLEESVTHTLVVDHEISCEAIGVAWDTEWAMCQICTEHIQADAWLFLRRRAFASFEAMHGPMHEETKDLMRLVYQELREAFLFIYQEPELEGRS